MFCTSQEIGCYDGQFEISLSALFHYLNKTVCDLTQLSLVFEIEFYVLLMRFRTGRWYRAQVKLNTRTSQRSRSDWSTQGDRCEERRRQAISLLLCVLYCVDIHSCHNDARASPVLSTLNKCPWHRCHGTSGRRLGS